MSDRLSQLLFLDSNHASQIGDTPSDLIFNLNFNAANGFSNYGLSVQEVSIPNMVYPINQNNNKIYFKENGGATLTATIPSNNYTGAQIVSTLKTILDAAGTLTYTVNYDSQSKKLDFLVLLPDVFQFVAGDKDAYTELGFKIPTIAGAVYTGDYPVYLPGSQYIDIQMNLSTNNYSSNGKSNIFDRIPLNKAFGSIIYYQNTSDDFVMLNEDSVNILEVRILDDKGNLWALPNNAVVAIVCKLTQFI